jgi:tRNA pseudouridine55 synthase
VARGGGKGPRPSSTPCSAPGERALGHWPAVRLSADAAFYLQQGQAVMVPQAPTEGLVRLYDVSQRFLGVGEILDDGKVQPKRLI